MIKTLGFKKTLIVTAESDEVAYKSARNVAGVAVIPANNINVYDLLKFEKVIMTKDAVSKIEEVYA
jgi:large subunit ribosomal protein L4